MTSISGISTGYLPGLSTPKKTNNAEAVSSTPFGDLLSKQGLAIGNSSATALSKLTPSDSSTSSSSTTSSSATEEFQKYMEMSPAEKIRYNMLKDLGLSEDQLQALPPEQRAKIETAIADRIKEQLQRETENAAAAANNGTSQNNIGPAGLFQAIQANTSSQAAQNDQRLLDIYS